MVGLELQSIRALRGPNLWARVPVLDLKLCVTLDNRTSAEAGHAFRTRILNWWSALTDPSRIAEGPGAARSRADLQSLRDRCGTRAKAETDPSVLFLSNLLTELALTLQTLAGTEVAFGQVLSEGPSNLYRLIVEYEEEELARACLAVARNLGEAAAQGQSADLVAELKQLRRVADDVCLGPSTRAIVQAARRRAIPIRRLNRGSLVQLGQGIHQHRICAAETDRTAAISETIASDKELTKRLLKAVGVPVPAGRLVSDAEDAWRATCELGGPVVVKPLNGNHGRAVFIGLTKREETTPAYELACTEGDGVIVERAIRGAEHRLLVVGERVAAATRGDPVFVVGDGTHTITELVAELNRDPRRGEDADCPLAQLEFDSSNRATLAQQGYRPDSVPPARVRVLVQRNGNLARDVTDQVHPDNAATAVLAAKTVGLDIAGVDLVADNIAVPLREQGGAVVEVNAGPGLQMHMQPAEGTPRPVGEAIVASLFPADGTGHIPIVAVQDSPHSTAITQLIGRMLGASGVRVGVACAAGVFIDQRHAASRNAADAGSAADLLLHPALEAAVFETSEGAAVNEGLGFDRCQVAVLAADDGAEQGASDRSQSPPVRDALRRTLIQTVIATGTVVVSADGLTAEPVPGPASIPWASSADHPLLVAHRRRGGKAVFLQDGAVMLGDGSRTEPVSQTEPPWPDRDLPLLAAVAAAWALGQPTTTIRTALASWLADRA
jgi:cyanophycin synthetase